ncbi:MAG TPA: orotidine-5'-phosphate decarboxylase [Cyclobacteriaceae bacterium]|nr:orotidine-5'-phosphate decarboxylase [Cyclobacteriaceae bacterium]
MTRKELISEIRKKSSFLCVGLDTDINKIPRHLLKSPDPVFEFNKAIIDSTADSCIAYKPNLAFYEILGPAGLESLQKTLDYIPREIFKIGDGKRGDIGNTGKYYAEALFNFYGFDAATVVPYMGKDSVEPFFAFKEKWTILLALTSNTGASDFQQCELMTGEKLFEHVISESRSWAGADQLMYVIGATRADLFSRVRILAPETFLLVPGIGAQGGDLESVTRHGINKDVGLIVNASRSILYASEGNDFHVAAKHEAASLREKMKFLLENIF